jgi:hypothetical protein
MAREAFDTMKRYLCSPKVSCAKWVGTGKYCTMAYGAVEGAEQAIVLWLLDEGNCESEKNIVHTKQRKCHILYLRF